MTRWWFYPILCGELAMLSEVTSNKMVIFLFIINTSLCAQKIPCLIMHGSTYTNYLSSIV